MEGGGGRHAGATEGLPSGELIDPAIEQSSMGVSSSSPGDGALAEFASVVDAVQCAAAIQRQMVDHDQGVPWQLAIQFRIGVNLGDVIVDEGDIYGDEVQRRRALQASLAEPGGVCLSGTAFDHVVNKADVGFTSLGEKRLKNIADPVRVYRILLDPSKAGKRLVGHVGRVHATLKILAGIGALLIAALSSPSRLNGRSHSRHSGPPSRCCRSRI